MSQAETLQDIYSKIADIYDKFCNLSSSPEDETELVTNISLSDTTYTATALSLSNPDNKASITAAQLEINNLIAATMAIAKDDRLPTDAIYAASDGSLIPIPKDSPIALLPDLLKALLLYKAPLKFLATIIADIIQDVLREHIKRKLTEKTATRGDSVSFNSSKILSIPSGASHLIIQLSNFPSYISKRFDQDIDKSIIKTPAQANPDLSKYIRDGLANVSFGIGLSGEILTKNIFWTLDIKVEYVNQIIEIPKFNYVNIDKYAYVYLNENMNVNISYFK